jgi:hypothetical protein
VEAGFSMLDFYGRHKHGLDIEAILEFADSVNRRAEAASLHLNAPISALPRRYFREIDSSDILNHIAEFRRDFSEFIDSNRQTIKAKHVLIDRHVSLCPVAAMYLRRLRISSTICMMKQRSMKSTSLGHKSKGASCNHYQPFSFDDSP